MVSCLTDLKRNEYTPDKVTFPQEDPPNPGGGVKESRQSMRLMLWSCRRVRAKVREARLFRSILSQSQGAEGHAQSTGRAKSPDVSACGPCNVTFDQNAVSNTIQPSRLSLFPYINEEEEILTNFVKVYENKCLCIWTGSIDRYTIIAEGLLFIMKFEKLPCFKKKNKKWTNLKCIVYLLQQRQDSLLTLSLCDSAFCHHVFITVSFHRFLSLR